jgi:hypothetical protein
MIAASSAVARTAVKLREQMFGKRGLPASSRSKSKPSPADRSDRHIGEAVGFERLRFE